MINTRLSTLSGSLVHQRAAQVVVALLSFMIAMSIGDFLNASSGDNISPAPAPQFSAISSLTQIPQAHLFGDYQASLQPLPKTTLPLTLKGLMDTEALISSNGQQASYAVGSVVPGGAIIVKFLPNAVVLDEQGRETRLTFNRPALQFTPPDSTSLFS